MDGTKRCKIIAFGAMAATKPYESIWFCFGGYCSRRGVCVHTKPLPRLARSCGREPGEGFSGIGKGVFFDEGLLGISPLWAESTRAAALAVARRDSCNRFEEAGPEWRIC